MSVHAEGEKTVACLGTNAIKAPTPPSSAESEWQGSYVSYGQYYNYSNSRYESLMYRVLSPDTTDYGSRTMLLDCVKALSSRGSNNIEYLNGSGFLEMESVFTSPEKSAIASSKIDSYEIDYSKYDDKWMSGYKNYTALNGEKIFYLDMIDLMNPDYGFSNTSGAAANRHKIRYGSLSDWWTRSATTYDSIYLESDGTFGQNYRNTARGVSPAFNVTLENVIFSSVIPGTGSAGADGTEYKLTLFDEGLSIALQDEEIVSVSDDIVSVPYCISGDNKDNTTQVSVLILDKAYNAKDTANTNILYYGKMNNTQGFSTTGTGTFSLPDDLYLDDWGTEYYVYMLAEDVNGEKETDYACYPVEIPAPQSSEVIYGEDDIICSIDAPAVDYDGNPHSGSVNVTRPESGAVIKYGTVKGTYDLDECPTYIEPGNHRVYYQITAEGYNTATGSFQVKINKLDSKIIKHPVPAEKLYKIGKEFELIKPGTAEGGTILYSKDNGRTFSADIPVINANTVDNVDIIYYVKGDENHKDSEQYTVVVTLKPLSISNFESEIEEAEEYYNYIKDNIKDNEDYSEIANTLKNAIETAKETLDKVKNEELYGFHGSDFLNLINSVESAKEVVDTIDQINAIPSVDKIAVSDRTAIENARGAYDSLTDDQKAKVKDETLDTLVEAEATLKDILDTIAANEVTDQINTIPSVDKIAASDKTAIENARGAYDSLTDDQKAKVKDETLKKLTDAEGALAKAIENANKKPSNNNANQSSGSKKTDTNKNNTDNTKKTSYSNEWVDGKWYDKNGKQSYKYKGSWKKNSKGWWFEDENEWCPYSQWQKIDGKWYYFTDEGYMDYSEYRDGCWLGSDGAWVEAYSSGTWHYSVKGWWYSDGSWYAADQDLWIDGTKYHFNSKGYWKE